MSILRKKKPCIQCGEDKFIWAYGRCKECDRKVNAAIKKTKKKEAKEKIPELIKKLDEVYSKWLRKERSIDGEIGQCYTCKTFDLIKNLQCGHYISRKYFSVRWLFENTFIQCYNCNCRMSGNYRVFTDNLIKDFGKEYIDNLEHRKNNTVKYDRFFYEQMINHYTNELNKQ